MHNDHQTAIAPGFLRCLAWGAIIGAVALVLGNIIGSIVVPGHDWVADTVSDLAAGRFEIIQDVALYGFAGTLAALALAAAHLHRGNWQWSALALALLALSACVVVIAARNEYGDRDNEGVVIHIYLVYLLGLLFAGVFALAGRVGGALGGGFSRVSWGCCVLWAIAAPIFFFLPTSFDGLYERGLGVITLIWTVSFARALLRLSHNVKPDRRI